MADLNPIANNLADIIQKLAFYKGGGGVTPPGQIAQQFGQSIGDSGKAIADVYKTQAETDKNSAEALYYKSNAGGIPFDTLSINGQKKAAAGGYKSGDLIPKVRASEMEKSSNLDFTQGIKSKQQAENELTPEALDTSSQYLIKTGTLPEALKGFGMIKQRVQVANRAAEMMGQQGLSAEGLALKKSIYKSTSDELTNLQKNRGQILAFENTAQMNLDQALQLSDKVDRTGVPIVNKWLLAGKRGIAGDTDVTNFDAAVQTAINEYARVVTTVTGGGVTSDSARKEVENLLNTAQSPEQIKAVINQLKTEMTNRRLGYEKQISDTQAMIGSSNQPGTSTAPSTPGTNTPAPQQQPIANPDKPKAKAAAPAQTTQYTDPLQVKADIVSGKIKKDAGLQILKNQFGM